MGKWMITWGIPAGAGFCNLPMVSPLLMDVGSWKKDNISRSLSKVWKQYAVERTYISSALTQLLAVESLLYHQGEEELIDLLMLQLPPWAVVLWEGRYHTLFHSHTWRGWRHRKSGLPLPSLRISPAHITWGVPDGASLYAGTYQLDLATHHHRRPPMILDVFLLIKVISRL